MHNSPDTSTIKSKMNLVVLSFRCMIVWLIFSVGLESTAQLKHDQYLQIPIDKLNSVLNDGIKIICRGKDSPVTFFMPSPEVSSSFYPHLLSVEQKLSPKEAFLHQIACRSSLTNFGWQEGSVRDGLAALYRTFKSNNIYQKAIIYLYGRLTSDGFLTAVAHSNMKEGGEPFQRKTKGTILQFGLGMMAQLVAEFEAKALQKKRIHQLKSTKNLVALWDFKEPEGQAKKALGQGEFPLTEQNGTLPRMSEGPLSGYSIQFGNKAYLSLPNAAVGRLNIHGNKQGVTVLAWVKWTGEQTGFVGGMWNEYQDGGKRQYGLFVSLPHYNGKNQVCGHVSQTGKPTPPFPYSCDYAASKQEVPVNQWVCIAFTYDGKYIKSYLNGIFERRDPELINNTKGFEGYPDGLVQSKNPYYFPYGMGNNRSDFTVGSVLLKSGMGNFFKGQIGGLAVYDRALSLKELKELAE